MPEKTNAARILDKLHIDYELHSYEVDEDDLSVNNVANKIGVPVSLLYKTLVLRGDKTGIFVCVIPGNKEVDLKKAAKVSGNKKAEMIAMKELLPTTGYIRGGCTAIGMKKNYPVFLSEEALQLPSFYVSAGKRGLQIKLSPADHLKASSGTPADITTE